MLSDQPDADLAKLAEKHRLPSIYGVENYAALGGQMDYGADLREMGRNVATNVDLILKGARPADPPVQVPSNFYLRINLKTAKARPDDPAVASATGIR